jgi:NADP-dependent 3-hydroxy acid dehydrogenase YdfG
MKVSGNTVFILGFTSGIGPALALALHAKGNTVIIGGRRTALLEQIAAAHPGIDTVPIDVTDAASVQTAANSRGVTGTSAAWCAPSRRAATAGSLPSAPKPPAGRAC